MLPWSDYKCELYDHERQHLALMMQACRARVDPHTVTSRSAWHDPPSSHNLTTQQLHLLTHGIYQEISKTYTFTIIMQFNKELFSKRSSKH